MKKLSRLLIGLTIWINTQQAVGAPPSFAGISDLVGEELSGFPTSVSGDGSVIVGSPWKTGAFRWSADDGLIDLNMIVGWNLIDMILDGYSPRVSQDGSTVVGARISNSDTEAIRWTENSGLVGLGDLPGNQFQSHARDVSADGSVIVGHGNSNSGTEAFRWTESEGLVPLGDLVGGSSFSEARAVSADGSVIVGNGESASGHEAFRWTEATGMVGLGVLDGNNHYSRAHDISANGNVIVGVSSSGEGYQPFRWTEESGMVGLGVVSNSGAPFDPHIGSYSVSGDGSVIVGWWYLDDQDSQAFIWDESNGMRSLKDVLMNEYGLDLTGWELGAAVDISYDARTIVGFGGNPDGKIEGWVAVVPEPSSFVLAGFAAVGFGLLARRRKKFR